MFQYFYRIFDQEDAVIESRLEQQEKFARKLLANGKLSIKEIAAITEIPLSKIKKLKAEAGS